MKATSHSPAWASGMERASDAVLNGSDDRLFGRRLSDLVTGRDPSGGNVVLTIDPAVQKVAYDQLTRKKYAGAVVALQPATGVVRTELNGWSWGRVTVSATVPAASSSSGTRNVTTP